MHGIVKYLNVQNFEMCAVREVKNYRITTGLLYYKSFFTK